MTQTPEHHTDHGTDTGPEKPTWVDKPQNVHKIFWALVVVCTLLMLSDLFVDHHGVFAFQNWFGFFGLFGFGLSFLLVLTSRELRKVLMRKEDYYD